MFVIHDICIILISLLYFLMDSNVYILEMCTSNIVSVIFCFILSNQFMPMQYTVIYMVIGLTCVWLSWETFHITETSPYKSDPRFPPNV